MNTKFTRAQRKRIYTEALKDLEVEYYKDYPICPLLEIAVRHTISRDTFYKDLPEFMNMRPEQEDRTCTLSWIQAGDIDGWTTGAERNIRKTILAFAIAQCEIN